MNSIYSGIDCIQSTGKHAISTDGGTWYPQACKFLKLKHHIHIHLKSRASSKGQCNISRIEPKNVLMTIFHAERRNVN
jgi:hypothetical protein